MLHTLTLGMGKGSHEHNKRVNCPIFGKLQTKINFTFFLSVFQVWASSHEQHLLRLRWVFYGDYFLLVYSLLGFTLTACINACSLHSHSLLMFKHTLLNTNAPYFQTLLKIYRVIRSSWTSVGECEWKLDSKASDGNQGLVFIFHL